MARAGPLALALLLVVALPLTLDAQAVASSDGVAFVTALQRAVTSGDRRAFASLVRFPITVFASGWAIPITDSTALSTYYTTIVTDGLKEAVGRAYADVRAGRVPSANVRISAESVLIGVNVIHAQTVEGRLRIVRMTLPPAPRTRSVARREPQAIQLHRPGPTKLSGALRTNEEERYTLWVPRGRLLTARLEEVAGRDIVMRLGDAATGAPLDRRAGTGVRAWTGRVRADTDVQIVVRREGGAAPTIAYVISIDVR